MSQSLSKLYLHLIFHIKNTPYTPILKEDRAKLYAYMATIIKDCESHPLIINGTENHVHILCIQSKNISLSKFVQTIKGNSSRWISGLSRHYETFNWQTGYAGFSVSPSLCTKTLKYIQNQEEHHAKRDFKEEYLLFLKEYNIDFDEKYIWED